MSEPTTESPRVAWIDARGPDQGTVHFTDGISVEYEGDKAWSNNNDAKDIHFTTAIEELFEAEGIEIRKIS